MEENERLDMTTTKGDSSPIKYSRKEIDLIKSIHAKGATDDEFKLMIHLSKEYGLNILQKHIWLIKFGNAPALIFVGRDGFLDIAHRSGYFDGMETTIETVNEPFSVTYTDTTWVNNKPVKKPKTVNFENQFIATCTIYRKDTKHPIKVSVYESEYSTGRDNWFTKRRTMIGKVAESQALRKGFSVSGVYAPEEIDLSKPPVTPEYEVQPVLPKRSEVAKKLNPENCTDIESYNTVYKWFCEEFGERYLDYKSGHKNEIYRYIFTTAHNRINRVSPIDNQDIEQIKTDWKQMADNCSDLITVDVLENDIDKNPCLDTVGNREIIENLKKEFE